MHRPIERRRIPLVVLALTLSLGQVPAAPGNAVLLTVAQDGSGDYNGRTEQPIQNAVDAARDGGGGTVVVRPGTYVLNRGLDLAGRNNVLVQGEPGVVLKLAPQRIGTVASDVVAGEKILPLEDASGFFPGARIEIRATGRTNITPSGKKHAIPYVMAVVDRVEGNVLHLQTPLKYAVPRASELSMVFNAISVRGRTIDLALTGLTIDMNRDEWPLPPLNHTYHCGVFAAGPYSYEKGPTGPPVELFYILDCTIKNAHHRGIAWYSVCHGKVHGCTIENTHAEGIDLDHFCYYSEVVNNRVLNCRNIELNDASHCLVTDNTIEDCGVGIVIWQWCKLPDLNVRNLVLGNTIRGAKGIGIHCRTDVDNNTIRNNTVIGSRGAGIRLEGAENSVAHNTVEGSGGNAIEILGAGNAVHYNQCEGKIVDTGKGNDVVERAP
ncbi:MAG: DUF1565 domain-containing protein [Lentisphaerae bacterium]|nr:DUF1565 domain-containing protein [Lentisphaerota bacterium]MBT4817220.1 DUF1565 domain-containing protein [Lentisphaerota bacterium]MBT5605553.1 DUF1565 domain-containing protein [Lentisphaerota bacterium]MBT7056830.1 DUF1565 domain-containing protein [Lentisphaerota bacterium]MBT7845384.1 DUF1565 domain-containing protein [Lentisphaerota bacterium]